MGAANVTVQLFSATARIGIEEAEATIDGVDGRNGFDGRARKPKWHGSKKLRAKAGKLSEKRKGPAIKGSDAGP